MPKTHIHIEYQLTFDAAFHMGTGLRSGLIHRAVAKDPDGFLYVPGSTVKGVLRDRCAQIGALFGLPPDDPHRMDLAAAHPHATLVAAIFGSQFRAGSLHFDDAKLVEEDRKLFEPVDEDAQVRHELRPHALNWQTEKRTQVSIWRPTRTAEQGFLYNSEYGIRGLRFDGRILGFAPLVTLPASDAAGGRALLLMVAGLLSVERIGANKSSGAGVVKCTLPKVVADGKELTPDDVLANLAELAGGAVTPGVQKEGA